MATPMTYSHRPIPFAIPAQNGMAILPQTVALGVTVSVGRPNAKYFGIQAAGFRGEAVVVDPRLGSVWWDAENERWAVQRHEPGQVPRTIARFRERHLRQALLTAVVDTATEYVMDRDDLAELRKRYNGEG